MWSSAGCVRSSAERSLWSVFSIIAYSTSNPGGSRNGDREHTNGGQLARSVPSWRLATQLADQLNNSGRSNAFASAASEEKKLGEVSNAIGLHSVTANPILNRYDTEYRTIRVSYFPNYGAECPHVPRRLARRFGHGGLHGEVYFSFKTYLSTCCNSSFYVVVDLRATLVPESYSIRHMLKGVRGSTFSQHFGVHLPTPNVNI